MEDVACVWLMQYTQYFQTVVRWRLFLLRIDAARPWASPDTSRVTDADSSSLKFVIWALHCARGWSRRHLAARPAKICPLLQTNDVVPGRLAHHACADTLEAAGR